MVETLPYVLTIYGSLTEALLFNLLQTFPIGRLDHNPRLAGVVCSTFHL